MEANARMAEYKEDLFPQLITKGYWVKSDSTQFSEVKYNCLAYAVGDETRRWEPPLSYEEAEPGTYWPPNAPNDRNSLETYIRMFETEGFTVCEDGSLEEGFEKVAVYWGAGIHAAKQLEDGTWTSKLGQWEDIVHPSLEALETDGKRDAYGKVAKYMKRPRPKDGDS